MGENGHIFDLFFNNLGSSYGLGYSKTLVFDRNRN